MKSLKSGLNYSAALAARQIESLGLNHPACITAIDHFFLLSDTGVPHTGSSIPRCPSSVICIGTMRANIC